MFKQWMVVAAISAFAGGGMVPAAARAADPGSGQVDPAAPRVEWGGKIVGPTMAQDIAYGETGGTHGTCVAPTCDTFTLTVAGSAERPLTVATEMADPSGNNITLEVVLPDGSTAFDGGTLSSVATSRKVTVPSAPDGVYAIRVTGETQRSRGFEMGYSAWAHLGPEPPVECKLTAVRAYPPGGSPVSGAPTNDPLYGFQAGHTLMNVAAAWARGHRGQGTVIAILDTGIDPNHPEFEGRLLPGRDYHEGKKNDCAAGPIDVHGHGTHVAGLAAAAAGNGQGIAGVAPEAAIIPIRVCDYDGTCDDIFDAIRWAADQGADVINLSLGGGPFGAALGGAVDLDVSAAEEAVTYAWEKGAVIVGAAGNSNDPFCLHPGGAVRALCAAATDRRGLPTRYSAQPFKHTSFDGGFRAFGGDTTLAYDIDSFCREGALSTMPPALLYDRRCGGAYGVMQGTSMAAPHLAGAAALLAGAGLSNEQIVERLKATGSSGGVSLPVMGYGIPDLDAATKGLPPAPAKASRSTAAANPPAAAQRPRTSRTCRSARARLELAIKRAVRDRNKVRRTRGAARRRATRELRVALRKRDRAQVAVRRAC